MRPIRAILEISARWTRSAMTALSSAPISDASALDRFLAERAAHVAQTALYGYLKTRMGTQFRTFFEDDAFADAIRTAQESVFVACLSDLTIYTVARLGPPCANAHWAQARFRAALEHARPGDGSDLDATAHIATFSTRAGSVDWTAEADNPTPFAQAAAALITHAPVSEAFKAQDRQIVENSLTFRMAAVQDDLRRRLDRAAIAAEARAGL